MGEQGGFVFLALTALLLSEFLTNRPLPLSPSPSLPLTAQLRIQTLTLMAMRGVEVGEEGGFVFLALTALLLSVISNKTAY